MKVVYICVTVPTYERCSILIYAMKQQSLFLIWAMSVLLKILNKENIFSSLLRVSSSVWIRQQWYILLDFSCRQQTIDAMLVAVSCYIFKIFDDFHSEVVGNINLVKFINTQSMRTFYVFDEVQKQSIFVKDVNAVVVGICC